MPLRGAKRGQKSNTSFFFSSFSGTAGTSEQDPGMSRQQKFVFPGFEGHTELFGPHPFTWKTPTPPEKIWTQKFGFVLFFRARANGIFPRSKLLRRGIFCNGVHGACYSKGLLSEAPSAALPSPLSGLLLGGRLGNFLFFLIGGREGPSEAPGRDGVGFSLKEGGGLSGGKGGGRGAGRASVGNSGGGGAKLLFFGAEMPTKFLLQKALQFRHFHRRQAPFDLFQSIINVDIWSGCRKGRSAKGPGVRSLFFVFRTLSVTFWSLFLMLPSLFLPSSFCRTPFAAGCFGSG